MIRKATKWLLPGRMCPCCGTVTFAEAPPGAHAGSVSYGPVLNAAAVLLACYGNVPSERAALVIGMLPGVPASAGWVDKAAARVSAQLGKAGFDGAMLAALATEDVLAADETPVNVLDKAVPQPAAPDEAQEEKDPGEKQKEAGAPHVLIVRTPDGRLTWLQAIASRRKAAIAAGIPAAFAGWLITDGYTGYQHLLERLAGIRQCCQHVIRRCRAVTKLGPGSLQSWAGDIIRRSMRPAPAAAPPWTCRHSTACGNAATRRSGPGSSTAGCGTGTPGTTPATRSAAGCATTRNRSSCSPATSPWTGPTTDRLSDQPCVSTRFVSHDRTSRRAGSVSPGGSACRGQGKGRARQKTAAKRAVRQLGRSHNCPGR